jgi:phenylacetate-CoA ligase
MIIVRGVNVYPSHVEHLLLSVEGVSPHWRLIVERPGFMDELTLECEPAARDSDRPALAAKLERDLREGLGVRVAVSVLDPGSVPRSEGKAVRVVDRRGGSGR